MQPIQVVVGVPCVWRHIMSAFSLCIFRRLIGYLWSSRTDLDSLSVVYSS